MALRRRVAVKLGLGFVTRYKGAELSDGLEEEDAKETVDETDDKYYPGCYFLELVGSAVCSQLLKRGDRSEVK